MLGAGPLRLHKILMFPLYHTHLRRGILSECVDKGEIFHRFWDFGQEGGG